MTAVWSRSRPFLIFLHFLVFFARCRQQCTHSPCGQRAALSLNSTGPFSAQHPRDILARISRGKLLSWNLSFRSQLKCNCSDLKLQPVTLPEFDLTSNGQSEPPCRTKYLCQRSLCSKVFFRNIKTHTHSRPTAFSTNYRVAQKVWNNFYAVTLSTDYVLPVLKMTLCFHSVDPMVRPVYSYKRIAETTAPIPNKFGSTIKTGYSSYGLLTWGEV